MIRIFVYGTLKGGEPNYSLLTNKNNGVAEFKGTARTAEKYPLVIDTKYNIPFLLFAPGTGHYIAGEVYEVDDAMLVHLDELEGHPEYYTRQEHEVFVKTKDGQESKSICWIYFLKNFDPRKLNLPMLSDYKSDGEHGRPYLDRDNESTVEDLNNF